MGSHIGMSPGGATASEAMTAACERDTGARLTSSATMVMPQRPGGRASHLGARSLSDVAMGIELV